MILALAEAEQIWVVGRFGVIVYERRNRLLVGRIKFGFGDFLVFLCFLILVYFDRIDGDLGFGILALDVFVVYEFDYLVEGGVDVRLSILVQGLLITVESRQLMLPILVEHAIANLHFLQPLSLPAIQLRRLNSRD